MTPTERQILIAQIRALENECGKLQTEVAAAREAEALAQRSAREAWQFARAVLRTGRVA